MEVFDYLYLIFDIIVNTGYYKFILI